YKGVFASGQQTGKAHMGEKRARGCGTGNKETDEKVNVLIAVRAFFSYLPAFSLSNHRYRYTASARRENTYPEASIPAFPKINK
ncbi:MAG: hypothetical protein WAW23_05460, partial [Candidatus Methanoperedens sp.]